MQDKTQKISTILFVVIFCVFLLKVVSDKPTTLSVKNSPSPFLHQSFSGIAKVIDGDSIKVANNEVRLLGIDAPEYLQICYDAHDQQYACGKMSQKFLFDLVHEKQITCYYQQKDVYRRFLANCEMDQISINKEILRNGMAVIYDYNNADDELKAIEKEAKHKKLGIWQGKFQLPKEYRKRHK